MLTYQDYLIAADRETFIIKAIDEYKNSHLYTHALTADRYYSGENMITGRNSTVDVDGTPLDLAAIRTPSAIFKRLIIQLVQTIWAYGVQTDSPETKAKLGVDFDYIASWISENAALHSVAYGFWNLNKLQMFTALEYFPLRDERTGADVAGIRFWQLDEKKPMYVQFYEVDGFTEYTRKDNMLTVTADKRTYKQTVRQDALSTDVLSNENYGALPVVAMYANKRRTSELTSPIKNKIDLMDFVLTGFGDDVLWTKIIYWVLQGFGGTLETLQDIKKKIEKSGIVAAGDDANTATPHTIDLPFGAVEFALEKLESGIYLDFMGMRLSEITGGSLTNVAIETAQENLALKASDFEWQAFDFVRRIFALQGIVTENIKFKRRAITNKKEITEQVIAMSPYLDEQTILEKFPLIEPDEVERIMERKAAQRQAEATKPEKITPEG